ncbi:MAG: protocatechuate 3,4-dioxygenase beta subunit [Gammaproteobacteria bacterium]|jgi:protocatechuate 3,4-dioxygenase beta subunit
MNRTLGLLILVLILNSCKGQTTKNENKIVGGPCEDCEAALDYKLLNLSPKSVVTLTGFNETNPKLKITGTVYKSDGKTPAENVILYIYHTSRDGIYEPSNNPIGWEKRHGKFRGWLITNTNGEFTFYTFRPAPYPEVQESEHIHMYVKEPDKIPYYIDNFMFLDDPTLKQEDIESQKNRGGSGLINLKEQNGILIGYRDIILGLNIPNYLE